MSEIVSESMEYKYSRYKRLQREINDIDALLHFCGICYPSPEEGGTDDMSVTFVKEKEAITIKEKFEVFFGRKLLPTEVTFKVPKPLQVQIAKLLYEYRESAVKQIYAMEEKDTNNLDSKSLLTEKLELLRNISNYRRNQIIDNMIRQHNINLNYLLNHIGMSMNCLDAIRNHQFDVTPYRFIEISDYIGYITLEEFKDFINCKVHEDKVIKKK